MPVKKPTVQSEPRPEYTSPEVLKISGRFHNLMRPFLNAPDLTLNLLSEAVLKKMTVGDLESMAQSCNTQARPKAKK